VTLGKQENKIFVRRKKKFLATQRKTPKQKKQINQTRKQT
jgi:hypothetical protein